MICPRCDENLLGRQRTGKRCSKCGARFAFDPKTNRLRLNDLRVRRLVDGLTDGGQFVYTAEQFRWACNRKRLRVAAAPAGIGCAVVAAVVGTGLVLLGVAVGGAATAVTVVATAVLLGLALLVTRWHRIRWIGPGMSQRTFDMGVVGEWTSVYGEFPAGMLAPAAAAGPGRPGPVPGPSVAAGSAADLRLVVVCLDDAVRRCLWANAVTDLIGVRVVASLDGVPPGVPLAVLHDASPAGVLAAARVHAAGGPDRPVVDLGLRPATVMASTTMVRLRTRRLSGNRVAELRANATLSQAEVRWLGRGWWSPLAALKPAQLLALLDRAAQRAETASDPDRRHALEIGFLTWPTPA